MKCFSLFMILVPGLVLAAANEQSFTPDHIRKPIRDIILANSVTHAEVSLYQCVAGSEAGCLVDITDQAALQNLFPSSISIPSGTYDSFQVRHCHNEGIAHGYINGKVEINKVTYYTNSSSNPLTTDSASQGDVEVTFNGCTSTYVLPQPLTVSNGSSIELNLFSAPLFSAWARLGPSVIPSGCKQNLGGTQSVCMAYPEVVPYVSSGANAVQPTLELYAISSTSDSNQTGGAVLLITDSNAGVLAGFTRRIFLPGSIPLSSGFDTSLKSISANGDSSYTLENYGSTGTGPGYVKFNHFLRASHEGEYSMPSTPGQPTQHYYAKLVGEGEGEPSTPDCDPGMSYPFTVAPMDLSKLHYIVPLGNLNPSSHTFPTPHTYWNLEQEIVGGVVQLKLASIYAPGALTMTEISGAKRIESAPGLPGGKRVSVDYSMRFSVCKQLNGYFNHINILDSVLMNAAVSAGMPDISTMPEDFNCSSAVLPAGCQCEVHGNDTYYKCYKKVNIEMSAGQAIGAAGGHNHGAGWDFGLRDGRIAAATFANPSRYNMSDSGNDEFHVVCPMDYFPPALSSSLRSRLTKYGGEPVSPSIGCGTSAQDVAGSAKGNWFADGHDTYPEDFHIALARDNFDDTIQVFSIGNIGGTDPAVRSTYWRFFHQPNAALRTNVRFESIVDSQIYCFDHWQFDAGSYAVLLQLSHPPGGVDRLKIEKKAGVNCAALGDPISWSFTSKAQQFGR